MMVLSFVLFALYISASTGQFGPPKPRLSESFSAMVSHVGRGYEISRELYRDYEGGKLLVVDNLGSATGVAGSASYIANAMTKREYLFFEPYEYCVGFTNPSFKLQPYWTIVKVAKYKGSTTFNQKKVDIWYYEDKNSSFYIELGVSANNPTVPVFLFEGENGNRYGIMTIENYISGPPAASKFSVPAICKQKSALLPKRGTSPATKFAGMSTFEKLEKLSSELVD